MKLESIVIRDFRSIESLELSFKDDLELIRWILRSAATCSICWEVKSLPWSE